MQRTEVRERSIILRLSRIRICHIRRKRIKEYKKLKKKNVMYGSNFVASLV